MDDSFPDQENAQDRAIEYSLLPDRKGRTTSPEVATMLRRSSRTHESYSELVWRKFSKSKISIVGGLIVIALFILAIFSSFFSPYDPVKLNMKDAFTPPTQLHFFDSDGKF